MYPDSGDRVAISMVGAGFSFPISAAMKNRVEDGQTGWIGCGRSRRWRDPMLLAAFIGCSLRT